MPKVTQPASGRARLGIIVIGLETPVYHPGSSAAVLEDDIRSVWAVGKTHTAEPRCFL